ncbi:DNA-directed RNA polymerase subunit beta [Paenibacillus sp. CAU 1782]
MTDDVMNSSGNELPRQSAGNGRMTGNAAGGSRTSGSPTGVYPGAIPGGLSRAQRLNSVSSGDGGSGLSGGKVPEKGNGGETGDNKVKNRTKETWPEEDEEEKRFPIWARVAFWLFRKSIVPVIMVVMLLAGLYIGYVYLGKSSKDDVFEWSTWQHLYDLIFAES